jgi:hypothetical protein
MIHLNAASAVRADECTVPFAMNLLSDAVSIDVFPDRG